MSCVFVFEYHPHYLLRFVSCRCMYYVSCMYVAPVFSCVIFLYFRLYRPPSHVRGMCDLCPEYRDVDDDAGVMWMTMRA